MLIVSGELEQRRSLLPQTLEIDNFIVGGASVPALPDDPDPFESQGADGGVGRFDSRRRVNFYEAGSGQGESRCSRKSYA